MNTRWRLLEEQEIWTCKDGTQIPVKEMSDSHLVNTINMLHRVGEAAKFKYLCLPEPNGDMAQMCWEHELESIFQSSWAEHVGTPEGLAVLITEANKRRLHYDREGTEHLKACRKRQLRSRHKALTSEDRLRAISRNVDRNSDWN